MLIEVIGGSGSGKSEFAEEKCMELCAGEKIYIATMEPYDEESKKRVERHRKMRAGKEFVTMEVYTGLEQAVIRKGATVLLECMSNLAANEMYSPSGRKEHTGDWILKGIRNLCRQAEHVVVVTNQVFSDGIEYDRGTMEYLQVLGKINRQIAQMADQVYEVIHGIPLTLKGPDGEKGGAGL